MKFQFHTRAEWEILPRQTTPIPNGRRVPPSVRWRWVDPEGATKPNWRLGWAESWKHVLIANALVEGAASMRVGEERSAWPFGGVRPVEDRTACLPDWAQESGVRGQESAGGGE